MSTEQEAAIVRTQPEKIVVILHGIRDHGLWQSKVAAPLRASGFGVHLLNYGRFDLFRFVIPFLFRDAVARRIRKDILQIRKDHPGASVSVIAHSFGTWVIGEVLKQDACCRFERIIFCGSVLNPQFPFEEYGFSTRQPLAVLNDIGDRDPWPAIAQSITWGYGSAGTTSFQSPCVRNRRFAGFKHGDFLTEEFCGAHWLEFLQGKEVKDPPKEAKPPGFLLDALQLLPLKFLLLAFIVGLGLMQDWHWKAFYVMRDIAVDEQAELARRYALAKPMEGVKGVFRLANRRLNYVVEVYSPDVATVEMDSVRRWVQFRPDPGVADLALGILPIGAAHAAEEVSDVAEESMPIQRVEVLTTCRFLCATDKQYTVELLDNRRFSVVTRDRDGKRLSEATGVANSLADLFGQFRIDDMYAVSGPEGVPERKQANFARAASVPPGEAPQVFIDSTVWGSGSTGVGFTNRALYANMGIAGGSFAIPYAELAGMPVSVGPSSYSVTVGDKEISIAGSLVEATQLAAMIELVRGYQKLASITTPSVSLAANLEPSELEVCNEWVARVGGYADTSNAYEFKSQLIEAMKQAGERAWLGKVHVVRDPRTMGGQLVVVDMFKGPSSEREIAAEIQRLLDTGKRNHQDPMVRSLSGATPLYYRRSDLEKAFGTLSKACLHPER